MEEEEDKELQIDIYSSHCGILHWNYREFYSFPSLLREHGHAIEDLYLKGNFIKEIPYWISEIYNLTELHLHENNIEVIPEDISKLTCLRHLDIGKNKIQILPKSFTCLESLCSFIADNNLLLNLPKDIGRLKSLAILYISRNKLVTLPNSIGNCNSLKELVVDDNNLIFLPNSLIFLPNLTFISIVGNDFFYLPAIRFMANPGVHIGKNNKFTCVFENFFSSISENNNYINSVLPRSEKSDLVPDGCTYIRSESGFNDLHIIQLNIVDNMHTANTPPLYDLCLQKVCHLFGDIKNKSATELRKTLHSNLQTTGKNQLILPLEIVRDITCPTTSCRICYTLLYNYACIRVFKRLDSPFFPKLIIPFCSSNCAKYYTTSYNPQFNFVEVPWSRD